MASRQAWPSGFPPLTHSGCHHEAMAAGLHAGVVSLENELYMSLAGIVRSLASIFIVYADDKMSLQVLPALNGKLTGMAFRVPTSDVSVVDLG